RETIRMAVADAIKRFEPRLTDVRVTLRDDTSLQSKLRLRIDALLMVEPAPQPYVVETTFTPPDSTVSLLDGKMREE
ncbi:MAG: GPW/gp25 family protein, partial [Janthinobacterium lividum]